VEDIDEYGVYEPVDYYGSSFSYKVDTGIELVFDEINYFERSIF
jgi:hypothetical protein